MAWEARSGLKHQTVGHHLVQACGRNGLGSPFGIETATHKEPCYQPCSGEMAWEGRWGLKLS